MLLVAPQSSRAEVSGASPTAQPAIASACGKNIDENIAAAQKALQSNDNASHIALTCLIDATIAINQRMHNDEDGHPVSGVLSLPKFVVGPQPKQ